MYSYFISFIKKTNPFKYDPEKQKHIEYFLTQEWPWLN